MTEEQLVAERRRLLLTMVEEPWDVARWSLRAELARRGPTVEEFHAALKRAGLGIGESTLRGWLQGLRDKGPSVDGVRIMAEVLAEIPVGGARPKPPSH